MSAAMCLSIGLILLHPGETFAISRTYDAFASVGNEQEWGKVLMFSGVARIVALLINGAWRRTPIIRFAGSAIAVSLWANFAMLFNSSGATALSTGLGVYTWLFVFEGVACAFIVRDINHAERARNGD